MTSLARHITATIANSHVTIVRNRLGPPPASSGLAGGAAFIPRMPDDSEGEGGREATPKTPPDTRKGSGTGRVAVSGIRPAQSEKRDVKITPVRPKEIAGQT
jgi:hypothetical protein